MKSNNIISLLILFILSTPLFAQKGGSAPAADEEDYFIFPIKPGERGSLSGTMGELRSSHFHTGLDIRTGGRSGVPVHAAAAGDIVRISVNPTGYGNAVYIVHPNGTHTVYAHLDKFEGPIADHVRQVQYRLKKWDVEIYPKRGEFTVNKGDVIALSGNSGSSGGPHLHFDLRDANHDLLNPLKYGFEEVHDHTPPVARSLALVPLNPKSRIEGELDRKEYDLRRKGNDYYIDEPINVYGNVGLELWAYDLLDNSRFHTGITEMEVVFNGETVHKQEINTFSFSDQRNILVHMPYKELRTSGKRYHKLYIDEGNKLNIYQTIQNGLIFSKDSCAYPVKIIMRDTYNNESSVSMTLRCKKPEFEVNNGSGRYGHLKSPQTELMKNTLKIRIPIENDDDINNIVMYEAGVPHEIAPEYKVGDEVVYLYNLREGLPDSANFCGTKEVFNYKASVPSNKEYAYYDDHINLHFPYNSLFDTLYLTTDYVQSENREYFSFGDPYKPLRRHLSVTLKPTNEYDHEKYAVYAVDNAQNLYYQGGDWDGKDISFRTRDFGTYTIAKDDEEPNVNALRLSSDELKFRISDERSGIKDYEVTVDGEWVLMHYDYKRNLIWSEKLNNADKFSGKVILTVTDNQGNKKVAEYNL
ncbi:MAG: M23 family metallopeptidase [Candidatus Cyclobacteriaceae bacterium M2_1C_046]